jgi:ubiquinone/menaquinone biosynthesis C-methylase UbiE
MDDATFSDSIPALYEQHLGPILFTPYAAELAHRVPDGQAMRVVEVAAGTGVVTAMLADTLPAGSTIVATDLSPAMLAVAAIRVDDPGVEFRQADAQELPFDDGEFDLVVCQFGIMFVPDKAEAYAEMRRVLRPGGQALLSVWDNLDTNPLPQAVAEAAAARFPDDPPGFLARIPYGYHDAAAIAGALHDVGFRSVTADLVRLECRAASAYDIAVGFCQGTPLRAEIEAREPGGLDAVTTAVAASVAARFGRREISSRMQAIVVTAAR